MTRRESAHFPYFRHLLFSVLRKCYRFAVQCRRCGEVATGRPNLTEHDGIPAADTLRYSPDPMAQIRQGRAIAAREAEESDAGTVLPGSRNAPARETGPVREPGFPVAGPIAVLSGAPVRGRINRPFGARNDWQRFDSRLSSHGGQFMRCTRAGHLPWSANDRRAQRT